MARITDYATLVTAIGDYLARSDLSGYIPNFLQNVEAKIYRSLRLRAQETALSGTIASGVLALPADYLELKHAYIDGSPITFLERSTPETIYKQFPVRSASGTPRLIATEGDNFIFGPYPDDTYSISGIYYKQLTSLSASNTTNWFTTNAPDVLLYGALLEAQPFLMNDKRIPTWMQFYQEALETVNRQERRQKYSGSTLAIRTA